MKTYNGRPDMQQGEFRGVKFGVKSQSTDGGRRLASHEYPGRDEAYHEDLGLKSRKHQLEIIFVGLGYMSQRDLMLKALEKPGVSELIHPWLGRMMVKLETYGLRESTSEGGMAIFSCTFLRSGKQLYPISSQNTGAIVAQKKAAATLPIQDDLANHLRTKPYQAWIADAVLKNIDLANTQLANLVASMPAIPESLTTFESSLSELQRNANALVAAPYDLAISMLGMFNRVSSMFTDPLHALSVYENMLGFGSTLPSIHASTPSQLAHATNQQAIIDLVQRAAVVEAVSVSTLVVFSSAEHALSTRDRLSDSMDALAMTANDSVYAALMDLRVAMVRDLTVRAANMPKISSFRPQTTMPSIMIAQRLYGDARRADEIISRNAIAHPLFVSGGKPLEVLRA